MAKCKVSVTVDTKLIERVDQAAGESTRSQIVEEALAGWMRNRRRTQLETEIERYYAEMSQAERQEDESWSENSAANLAKTWG